VTGRGVEGASHFLVEDAPAEVAADLLDFFG
jgi:pimeloyl-ACP methyl ester carboxylesterase